MDILEIIVAVVTVLIPRPAGRRETAGVAVAFAGHLAEYDPNSPVHSVKSCHSANCAAGGYPQTWQERLRVEAVFNSDEACALRPKEWVMRSLKLILTASGFLSYFIGMIGISALTTSVVHSALAPRAVTMMTGG